MTAQKSKIISWREGSGGEYAQAEGYTLFIDFFGAARIGEKGSGFWICEIYPSAKKTKHEIGIKLLQLAKDLRAGDFIKQNPFYARQRK